MAQTISTNIVTYGSGNTNCPNINNSYNTNTTIYKSGKDAEIMRWLSPLEPGNRHDGVRTKRFEGVGNWLLGTREFRKWRRGGSGADQVALFCSGNPGSGKTYLSSVVIDTLCDQARKGDIAVAWLYCDFKTQQKQTTINMMGAILKRLVGSEIPEEIRKAFKDERRPLLADLKRMLRIAIASLPQVFICIDALDEYRPEDLPELLESLKDIVQKPHRTRIFLTGRPYVREDIQEYFATAVVIPITPKTEDIRNYLKMRLDKDNQRREMKEDFRAEIVRTIEEKMSDIFLLASLIIDAILREKTIGQRKKKLAEMAQGNGLSDAYTATLRQLKPEEGDEPELGLKALMWVSYSERPLRVEELCHALAVEIGSTDPDPENVPTLQTLLASCLGLVTVEASSSTVRLVHFTLQDHLLRDPTIFHKPHSTIAEICLTYLNFRSVCDLSPTLRSAPSTMPLLGYASICWGEHARRGMSENAKVLALRLLGRFDKHISAQLLILYYTKNIGSDHYFDFTRGPIGFTGLHGVSLFGIAEIVVPVLEMKKRDVNATDLTGSTALIWAAQGGREEVVKALLGREDVNPGQADTGYQTPLWWAVHGGHEGVVRLLLDQEDVNPNDTDGKYDRTPLSLAAENGYEGIVKMLLNQDDINHDYADIMFSQTPLSWAAQNGHDGIVKMLLELEDVNPDNVDTDGKTPLSWAAGNGHEGILKMLLELEEVNPDHADTFYGRTPLSWAAGNGHEGVVNMLLELKDVNPDHVGTYLGRTPLSWAAENGHEGVVRMLLELRDVDPDHVGTYLGRTPLSLAAGNGHEGVVKMLLEREDVNPNHTDTEYGRTPLSRAAENGHEGVVKMLLELKDVDPDHEDTKFGRTPLSWAACNGHVEVVKMLLEQEEVNPNHADAYYGRTPLSLAAGSGHEGVVKMLLNRAEVNLHQADTEFGQTPLSWAAENGHEGVVKMLLQRNDAHPLC